MEYQDFVAIAQRRPVELVLLIKHRPLSRMHKALAIECLGYSCSPKVAMPVLFQYLEDGDELYRESAVLGLGHFVDEDPSVRLWLEKIEAVDVSTHVRNAVGMVL